MTARITNLHADKVVSNHIGLATSWVTIEASDPIEYSAKWRDSQTVEVVIPDCVLNMPAGVTRVNDGLVLDVTAEQEETLRVRFKVVLEHPTQFTVHTNPDPRCLPMRLALGFDRSPISSILVGRVIALDPGHGGIDSGGRGRVGLLEKEAALDIARRLYRQLREAGARPFLTRTEDVTLTEEERFTAAAGFGAEVYVSIHTGAAVDPKVSGLRTLYYSGHTAGATLAKSIHGALLGKFGSNDRGIEAFEAVSRPNLGVPGVCVEPACISNWVEESMLRNPVFKERAAEGILNGIKRFFAAESGQGLAGGAERGWTRLNAAEVWPAEGLLAHFDRLPIRTHVLTGEDDLIEVVQRYVGTLAKPGDFIGIAESVVAILQGRAILPETVRTGWLARFLCRFPGKDGSLATPPAMQLAINEVGAFKVLLGAAAAAVGKALGRKGDFYRVAGHALALIDDIAGTMPPYDKYVVLGPAHPGQVVERIKAATGIDAFIADVNDKGCVDILACSAGLSPTTVKLLPQLLRDNPFGSEDEQTPIILFKTGVRNAAINNRLVC